MSGEQRGVETGRRSTESGDPDQPWLVVLCGLPGVGKSTVAAAVSERLEAPRLRTDAVRKELYDDPQYTDEEMASVYCELFERTEATIEKGESAVLDGTFARRERRHAIRDVADVAGSQFRLLEVVCERSVAEARIAARGEGPSDADVAVYRQFRETFDPIEQYHVVIDNSGTESATRAQVDRVFPDR